MVRVNGDGDGFIDLDEFIRFHRRSSTSGRDREEMAAVGGDESEETKCALRAAFDVFDVDKNGHAQPGGPEHVAGSVSPHDQLRRQGRRSHGGFQRVSVPDVVHCICLLTLNLPQRKLHYLYLAS